MSETKAPRDLNIIQSEYQQLCTKLGHVTYQINALSKDSELLNASLRELNIEAIEFQKAADAAKAEAATAVEGEAK